MMLSRYQLRRSAMLLGLAALLTFCLLAWLVEPLDAQSGGTLPAPVTFLPIVLNNGPIQRPPIEYDAVTVDNSGSCRADGRPAAIHG